MMLQRHYKPAIEWINQYQRDLQQSHTNQAQITIGLCRDHKPVARTTVPIFPADQQLHRTCKYVERHLKSLLWMHGGNRILLDAPAPLQQWLQNYYTKSPTGMFDSTVMGEKICGSPITIEPMAGQSIPSPDAGAQSVGRNLDGCRIGFDLGGSDRKCAALIDGEVVFSEEIPWDPYFQKDPQYHFEGIMDALKRAAKHLPRVDAIGGSAAGVYVDNEVRVASLFRGVEPAEFEKSVRNIFQRVQAAWDNVPFVVINDGEVTALAGAMSLQASALLGISMGTSTAAGYVTPEGHLTDWLNELAFVPVDYSDQAPIDEWSGDIGCAVQYFSQQGVARLAREAGMPFPAEMPLPEQLIEVQNRMATGDSVAESIYTAIGEAFGHTLAHWSHFYELEHILILGRVTSGPGGEQILSQARQCLNTHYPDISREIQLHIPDEKMKRHGQAIAAASLPSLASSRY